MSTYFFQSKIINKATQSAVASASYRSGESLYSERDEETKSYGKREVFPETHILKPDHAPEWTLDRERLWNEVEEVEEVPNAQLAREVLVAIPNEISGEEQTKLVKDFVQENFVDRGMVADIAIHRDVEHNPHAHIMLTVRPFDEQGEWANKRKRIVKEVNGEIVRNEKGYPETVSIATVDWNQRSTLAEWRKNFAEKVNETYNRLGIEATVSHLSYEDQGLDKIPKHRLTKNEYQFEKRTEEQAEQRGETYEPKTAFAQLNQEIEDRNFELEELNKKVVSLEKYRDYVQTTQHDNLEGIRKNADLSDYDYKSLREVYTRVRAYVDYDNAKDNVDKLGNWKKKLDYQKGMLKAERQVLMKAQKGYEDDPKNALAYGIIPSKFDDQFGDLVDSFNKRSEEFKEAYDNYLYIYEHSHNALRIQRDFAHEEFAFLYPEIAKTVPENDRTADIKADYVRLFKDKGELVNTIPEFEKSSESMRLNNMDIDVDKFVKEWKENEESRFILNRTKGKAEKEYKEQYQSYEADKTYKASIKLTKVRNDIKEKETTKDNLHEKGIDILSRVYEPSSVKALEVKEVAKIIENAQKYGFKESLNEAINDIGQPSGTSEKKSSSARKENEHSNDEPSGSAASTDGVVDSIMGMSDKEEPYDHERDKFERKKKKNYKDFGDFER